MVAQWLECDTFTAVDPGSIPGWGTQIPQPSSSTPKKIKKLKTKKERELQEENGTRKLICEKGVIGRIRVKVLGFQQFEITGHQ